MVDYMCVKQKEVFIIQELRTLLLKVGEWYHLNSEESQHEDNFRGCIHPHCSEIRKMLGRTFKYTDLQ